MRKDLIAIVPGLILLGACAMAPSANTNVADVYSHDTSYVMPLNVNLADWFAAHEVEPGKLLRMDPLFQTPRTMVVSLSNKGLLSTSISIPRRTRSCSWCPVIAKSTSTANGRR